MPVIPTSRGHYRALGVAPIEAGLVSGSSVESIRGVPGGACCVSMRLLEGDHDGAVFGAEGWAPGSGRRW